MKFNAGDKFEIDGISLRVEIEGCFPGGQGRSLRVTENSYQITVNGVPMDISERHLDLLRDSKKAVSTGVLPTEIVVEKESIEIVKPDVEVVVIKKRMGRPPKVR